MVGEMSTIEELEAKIIAQQARIEQLKGILGMTHELYSQSVGGYGFYRPDNPHNFFPDPACCNQKEISAHSKACEDYAAGRPISNDSWGIGTYTDEYQPAVQALAAPSDTSALEALVTKAGEKMREMCIAEFLTRTHWYAEENLRALPTVTLKDFKYRQCLKQT